MFAESFFVKGKKNRLISDATFCLHVSSSQSFCANDLNNGALLTLKTIKSWKWKREACKQHMPGSRQKEVSYRRWRFMTGNSSGQLLEVNLK